MKTINSYIQEKLVIGNNLAGYNYHPETKQELIDCIKDKIEKEGLGTKEKPLYLNDIDTSKITEMIYLFSVWDGNLKELSKNGYFDISSWDVSNVKNMHAIFQGSRFNGDISFWDVSNVKYMGKMFKNCDNFNCNLSKWNVSNVKNMCEMFFSCPKFKGKGLEKWDVSNVEDMSGMFFNCENFNNNLSNWNVSNVTDMRFMFNNCVKFTGIDLEKWNVKNVNNMHLMFNNCKLITDKPNWYKDEILPF